jgi:hypothetical protein
LSVWVARGRVHDRRQSVSAVIPCRSESIDVNDRVGEELRGFLRHVVTDAIEDSVVVLSGELFAVGHAVGPSAVEVAGDGDRRHADDGIELQLLLQGIVLGVARSEALSPPVVVDDDADVIGIAEGLRGAFERRVVEVPLR